MSKKSSLSPEVGAWIAEAASLEPPYDYFDFANQFELNQNTTNILYTTSLNSHLQTCSHQKLKPCLNALARYKTRKKLDCLFGREYAAYWNTKSSAARRMEKRALNAIENANDQVYAEIERISKKVCSSSNVETATEISATTSSSSSSSGWSSSIGWSSSTASASGGSSSSGFTSTSSPLTSSPLTSSDTIQNPIQHIAMRGDDVNVINISDPGVCELLRIEKGEQYVESLMEKTALSIYQLSDAYNTLKNAIIMSVPSASRLRQTIKANSSVPDFNLVQHQDLNFIDTTCCHFLNYMLSPRNPLLFAMKERSAAITTAIPVLNYLFLADNDIMAFQWIEILASLTGKVKWDGVAICLKNGRVTPVLVEFSGGIQFNATENKQTVDESKMMKSMITMIEYSEHMLNIEPPIPQYFVRSFANNLYFEALYKFEDGSFYKRCYVNIPFPTTPKELLEYVDGTPDMLAWKQAVVQFARGASKINT